MKLSNYPTRAYDFNSVINLLNEDAGYSQANENKAEISRAMRGINQYFDKHVPAKTKEHKLQAKELDVILSR